MTASIAVMWLTVAACAVAGFVIGPGLGVLVAIIGVVAVVVVASREEQHRAEEDRRRQARRDAALRAGGWQ